MKNRPSMPRLKVELTDDPWGCLCQDRRLTNKITRRFLMCIKVEALGLFVLLSPAIETCGIEETFFPPPSPSPSHGFSFSPLTSVTFPYGKSFSVSNVRAFFVAPRFAIYVNLFRFLVWLLSN